MDLIQYLVEVLIVGGSFVVYHYAQHSILRTTIIHMLLKSHQSKSSSTRDSTYTLENIAILYKLSYVLPILVNNTSQLYILQNYAFLS